MLYCEVRKILLYLCKCLVFSEVCQKNGRYRLLWCVDFHYLQPQHMSLYFFYGTSGHPMATDLWVTLLSPYCDPFQTRSTVWKPYIIQEL